MRTGQCLCGEIKFEVQQKPWWVGACHCKMCQRLSGGALQVWAGFKISDLKIFAGQPKEFSSSENVVRSSCPTCSSHLFFRYIDNNEDIYIASPALNGPELPPTQHIWWKSKMNWLCLDDELEKT
jgi:hypothetical protein